MQSSLEWDTCELCVRYEWGGGGAAAVKVAVGVPVCLCPPSYAADPVCSDCARDTRTRGGQHHPRAPHRAPAAPPGARPAGHPRPQQQDRRTHALVRSHKVGHHY